MTQADVFDRQMTLERLSREHFDVLVIGGGITGAGVALDAANRGLTTALVEQADFASGTSSKSSKLIHGGLRYLQQGEIRLVYEALSERQTIRHIAPHLVEIMPFMIPMFRKNGLLNPKLSRALGLAMWQYDLTGGLRIGKRHKRLSQTEALGLMPSLRKDNLDSAYLYYDAHADDARLTLEIIRTAVIRYGAVAANRCAVTALSKDKTGKVTGASVETNSEVIDVSASCVVSATGVWSDAIRKLDDRDADDLIRPAKGVHVSVPRDRLDTDVATIMPVPGDRRSVFVVPWGNVTYVGTTDTDYDGQLAQPTCTTEDVRYLLGALNNSTTNDITEADIVGSWAGLRPLQRVSTGRSGRTADLSRRHTVSTSASGVITVTGGKLTTYRRMAADAVDIVTGQLGLKRRCRTSTLKLAGADAKAPVSQDELGLHLHPRYGSQARVIRAMIDVDPGLGEPLVDGLAYVRAEAVYAVRHEMALTLDDVLSRRTRARLFDARACRTAARSVAELVAPGLGWDNTRVDSEVADFTAEIDTDLQCVDVSS